MDSLRLGHLEIVDVLERTYEEQMDVIVVQVGLIKE
jgi:hypothetical protein